MAKTKTKCADCAKKHLVGEGQYVHVKLNLGKSLNGIAGVVLFTKKWRKAWDKRPIRLYVELADA